MFFSTKPITEEKNIAININKNELNQKIAIYDESIDLISEKIYSFEEGCDIYRQKLIITKLALEAKREIYAAILASEYFAIYPSIKPMIEDYESRIDNMYFHRDSSSHDLLIEIKQQLLEDPTPENLLILEKKFSICSMQVELLNYDLLQQREHIYRIVNIPSTYYCTDLTTALARHQQLDTQCTNITEQIASNKFNQHEIVLLQAKLLVVKIKRFYMQAQLHDLQQQEPLVQPARDLFRHTLSEYLGYCVEKYCNNQNLATEFTLSEPVWYKINTLNTAFKLSKICPDEELTDLLAHSILAATSGTLTTCMHKLL